MIFIGWWMPTIFDHNWRASNYIVPYNERTIYGDESILKDNEIGNKILWFPLNWHGTEFTFISYCVQHIVNVSWTEPFFLSLLSFISLVLSHKLLHTGMHRLNWWMMFHFFLLFTVWTVKLATEMILMVLQWHSNTQREIAQISHQYELCFLFLLPSTRSGVSQCLPFILLSVFIFCVTLLNIYISSLCERSSFFFCFSLISLIASFAMLFWQPIAFMNQTFTSLRIMSILSALNFISIALHASWIVACRNPCPPKQPYKSNKFIVEFRITVIYDWLNPLIFTRWIIENKIVEEWA